MKIRTKLYLIMAILAAVLLLEVLLIINFFSIPMHREDIISRAWCSAYYIQQVTPSLSREEEQDLLVNMAKKNPLLNYLLIVDCNGKALAHSNPERIGMVFNDSGTMACARYGKSLQQIYTRDAGYPGSPISNKKTIDILVPDYDCSGNHIGAINVGISLDYLNQVAQNHYRIMFICLIVVLLVFYIATRKLYQGLISPINNTVYAIRKFKEGNYNEINVEERNDELGLLAREFNSMACKISKLMAELREAHEEMETRVKERTAELAAEKERLAVTLSSIGEGVISTLFDGVIVLSNEAAAKIVGVDASKLPGKNLGELLKLSAPPEKIKFRIKENTVVEIYNHRIILEDGSERLLDIIGSPICNITGEVEGMVWVLRDITDKQRFEEELIKASKLETLGVLARGLAHDFNNLLTIIAGNMSLARMMADSSSGEFLEEAEKATLQARGLAQQLLTYSRGGEPVKKTVTTASLLLNAVNFALSGSSVSCEFLIPEQIYSLEIDEGQISQVLNNLVINAIQVMPNGGVIHICAENLDLKCPDEKVPLDPGKYVVISITDQGYGIPEKYRSRVFESYFTTKENGSGLGLATSQAIIKKHGGYITFESNIGEGTTFYIYLPASEYDYENSDNFTRKPVKGQGRILIMDNDEPVRRVVKEMLVSLGYEVETTETSQELIEIYEDIFAKGGNIDAVIMDLTIQDTTGGKETIKALQTIDSEVRVIASSGCYSIEQMQLNYQQLGFAAFIAKPYGTKELYEVLQDLLSRES
jgi:PAS domain S-box-containing protein